MTSQYGLDEEAEGAIAINLLPLIAREANIIRKHPTHAARDK